MLRSAWLALVAGSLLSVAAKAATPPATPQGFGFCTVTDSSSAQATIWASPVFPLTYASSDPVGFQRSQELAGEFLAHVGTLGGSGTKSCVVLPTQGEAASFREEQRAIWDKRVYFIKIGDWREVAWTPAAWSPATAVAPPAELTRYFHCSATQVDIPDRSDRSRTVTTTVFARKVRGGNPMAGYDLAAAYTTQFKQQVRAHGLPEMGDCTPFDTRAEAEYQQRQILKLFKGFNMKFYEIAWTPDEAAIAVVPAAASAATAPAKAVAPTKGLGIHINAVTAELAQALGLSSTQGAWVVEVDEGSAAMKAGIKPMDVLVEIAGQAVGAYSDVPTIVSRLRPGFQAPVRVWRERQTQDLSLTIPGQPVAAAKASLPASPIAAPAAAVVANASAHATDNGQYCAAFVMHSKSALMLRTPIWEIPGGQSSNSAMSDSLSRLITAVRQANPGSKWMTFPPILCYDNSVAHAGETFCISNTYKHFGGSQMGAQFCNRSKEMIDQRWAEMVKADGGNARIFPWPVAP